METLYYSTEEYHQDNTQTMNDFLENRFTERFDSKSEVTFNDGSYAEVTTPENKTYAVRAMGNGDSYNHKITFELL